jgi:hypothetical protein
MQNKEIIHRSSETGKRTEIKIGNKESDGKGREKWKISDKNILRIKITVVIISFRPENLKGRDRSRRSFQILNT